MPRSRIKIKLRPIPKDRQIVRTSFTKQARGSLKVRLPNGQTRSFRDVLHRSAAMEAIAKRRFAHAGELVSFIAAQPNGFTAFVTDSEERA